jgi:hypothetical protein
MPDTARLRQGSQYYPSAIGKFAGHATARSHVLGILVQQFAGEFDDRHDPPIGEAVVDCAVLATRHHEPTPAQARQVV